MRRFAITFAVAFAGLATAADGAPPAYAPGLGDFMTSYVQPHHIKLWFAGDAGNWPLAMYEAKELGESFGDITTYQADWEGVPVAQLVKAFIDPALDKVQSAIQAKNAAQFDSAFKTLTAACNACHTTAKKPMIEVKVPQRNPYTDQVFAVRP
jgi:cytochrome c553